MIAFEKNKKIAVVFEDKVPETVTEANGIRILDDAGTKKCLIGKETDLFESQEDPQQDS